MAYLRKALDIARKYKLYFQAAAEYYYLQRPRRDYIFLYCTVQGLTSKAVAADDPLMGAGFQRPVPGYGMRKGQSLPRRRQFLTSGDIIGGCV